MIRYDGVSYLILEYLMRLRYDDTFIYLPTSLAIPCTMMAMQKSSSIYSLPNSAEMRNAKCVMRDANQVTSTSLHISDIVPILDLVTRLQASRHGMFYCMFHCMFHCTSSYHSDLVFNTDYGNLIQSPPSANPKVPNY